MIYVIRCIWKLNRYPGWRTDTQAHGQFTSTLYGGPHSPTLFHDLNAAYKQLHYAPGNTSNIHHYEVEEYYK